MQKTYSLINTKTKGEEYVKENDVMEGLYYGKYEYPKIYDNDLHELKENISKINNKIPMYDIYTENLYLVNKEDLYKSVFEEYYRFPTVKFLNQITEKQKEYAEYLSKQTVKDPIIVRAKRKIGLIKKFMDYFNNSTLLQTYIAALYDTEYLGKSITLCRNPSFIPAFSHIRPYFTKQEQECAGLNNKIISNSYRQQGRKLKDEDLRNICKFLNTYVIDASDLIKHHNYIIDKNLIGIINYYSMQGSYILNEYLRNEAIDSSFYLDDIVKTLADAIYKAPRLKKDIYVYRFIEKDFLKDLTVGDIYSENGFMSCSRDPFYKFSKSIDTFGWNLMKIKIPKEFSALCIETFSQFPNEQEVMLPPNIKIKLQFKNNKNIYYHPNKEVQDKINVIYEFVVVEEPKVYKINKTISKEIIPNFNFKYINEAYTHSKIKSYSNRDLIIKFIIDHTNSFNLFQSKIGSKNYVMIAEEYNSISSYKPFYAKQTDNGFSIYSLDNTTHSLLFTLEICENTMYVNYNIKYDSVNILKEIKVEDLVDFICKTALYFNTQKVIYYCDYVNCNSKIANVNDTTANNISSAYCNDIYVYLKTKKKKFAKLTSAFKPSPAFNYEMLDLLETIDPGDIIPKKLHNARDNRIYYIYHDTYLADKNNNRNCKDFYIWLVENRCGYVDDFITSGLFNIDEYKTFNPFVNDYYIFYPIEYLIDIKAIKHNPYINIYSRDEIFNDITRFANKRIQRFRNVSQQVYKRKNKLQIDAQYKSIMYLYS